MYEKETRSVPYFEDIVVEVPKVIEKEEIIEIKKRYKNRLEWVRSPQYHAGKKSWEYSVFEKRITPTTIYEKNRPNRTKI